MRSSEIVRTMDTSDDHDLSVSITEDMFVSGGHLVVLADTTQIPYHRVYLTVAEARKLAEYLTEQSAEAELLNLEAETAGA